MLNISQTQDHSALIGMEHNFDKYEDNFITDLNTPYDYESIMHYRPLSFNKNDSIPTITTTIPYFNEIIGQRLDFSAVDITRLNRMYDCGEYLFSWLILDIKFRVCNGLRMHLNILPLDQKIYVYALMLMLHSKSIFFYFFLLSNIQWTGGKCLRCHNPDIQNRPT